MATLNGDTRLCPIAVEKKDDFCASPPFCWHLDPVTGKMKCEDNSFIVMVRDDRFDGRDVNIEVNDVAEAVAVRNLLAKKPIVTTAHCHKAASPSSNGGLDSSVPLKAVDFVVLINTAHPLVSAQLDMAFQKAEDYLKEGNLFRISIAFSESLRQYIDKVDFFNGSSGDTMVWNCDIFISHGVSTPKCADHFFACKNTCQTALWFLCFPCCLLTGFPYILWRNCLAGFRYETIKEPVPVTYHDGPFLTGFDLHSFLYRPRKLSSISQISVVPPPDSSLGPKFVPGSPAPGPSHKGKSSCKQSGSGQHKMSIR